MYNENNDHKFEGLIKTFVVYQDAYLPRSQLVENPNS